MLPVNIKRFFVATYRVDFRKGHYGLLSEARRMALNPYDGDLIVFVSRNKKRIKGLFGDASGLTLIDKVFSKGCIRTRIRFLDDPHIDDVTYAEVAMLFEGSSYTLHKTSEKWLPNS